MGVAIGLAIVLPPRIAPFLPHWGHYEVHPDPVIPPASAQVIPKPEPAPTPAPIVLAVTSSLSIAQVQAYVKKEAKAYGVNPAKADWIIQHESSYCWREGFYDPGIVGPEPNGTKSYGCWQFNKNPTNSSTFDMACATDLACSTKEAMQWVIDGRIEEWSTMRFCKRDYPDCPF